ncbi:MAG: hypothetical protein ABIR96_07460 [Bdellovibrionota bacterium]
MRREICLWVEWTWSQGLLRADAPREDIDAWARSLAHALKRQRPRHFGSFNEAAAHVSQQIETSLAALSYGKRSPDQVHPKRLSYLQGLFQNAGLPNFVTQLSARHTS